MTRRGLMVLMVVGLVGCPKAPPPKKVEPAPPPDPRAEVREAVKFIYSTLETGDPDPIAQRLAPDVMAYGLAPSDTWAQRDPVINVARQELLAIGLGTATLRIRTGRIDVGVAPDGRSAWFWDVPRVEWETKARSTKWVVRVSGHLVKVDERWLVDAVHVSLAVPDEKIFAADAAKKYLPPADVLAERGADADQLVGLSRRVLDDVGVKYDRLSERAEVVIIGTGPSEFFENGKKFKELLKPQLAALKKSVFSYKVDGPIRARLAPGGHTGWVAANVVLRQGSGKKAITAPPFRVLWVFAEENGVWNLVSEHQSLALKDELRSPATDDELSAFEAIDAARRARVDTKPERGSASPTGKPSAPPPDGGLAAFD
ncbi:MAG: nuclear transport factor 2 family protein [Myxococcaceae bacterium]|nr:nuclear transport factor 2 family protein [Myxococcaceae bacterium]